MPAIRQGSAPEPLELTPTPPALSISIVSPTPRAAVFSFPETHNLEDSPYGSPSNSPFEPSLDGLDLSGSGDDRPAIPAPLPLSAYTRTLTPPNPIPSTSSAPAPAPRRRRNAPLDPNEPRPRRGEAGYVKRPENAFILFRRQFCGSNSASAASSVTGGSTSSVVNPATGKKARQADLSKTISAQWRALAPEERAKWEALAAEKKREHAEKHPDYVYRPQRKTSAFPAEDGKKRKGSMPLLIPPPIPPPVEFVLPRPRSHSHDPTVRSPAPYQSIQVPNVYAPSFPYSNSFEGVPPLSPDDMSLLPMIAQSSSMRGQQDNAFDYVPSFENALEFEASLQASDFLRAMFPPSTNPILSMPPLSLPTGGTPSSSESGSSPGSPYTPASSLVNAPFSTIPTPTPGQLLEAAYADPTPFSLDGATGSDPWTAYGMSLGAPTNAPMDFDFDLASIPGAAVGSGWSILVAPGEDAVMGGDPIVNRNVKEFGMGNGESAWGAGMEGWNGTGMEGF